MKRLVGSSPIPRLYAAGTSSALRVLAYHGVPDRARFRVQVEHLAHHYQPVSAGDVHAALHGAAPLPERALLVTFDDGDPSVAENGLPVLQEFRVPAAVFVVAGLIGTDQAFWWDEAAALFDQGSRPPGVAAHDSAQLVRALKRLSDGERRQTLAEMREGHQPVRRQQLTREALTALLEADIAIGNHTFSHPCLDQCDDTEVAREIDRAHQRITELVGRPPDTFAYPNGNPDPRALNHLTELGYRSVFLFDHRLQPLPGDPMAISRLRVDADADIETFALLVSGAHSFLHHRVLRRA